MFVQPVLFYRHFQRFGLPPESPTLIKAMDHVGLKFRGEPLIGDDSRDEEFMAGFSVTNRQVHALYDFHFPYARRKAWKRNIELGGSPAIERKLIPISRYLSVIQSEAVGQ